METIASILLFQILVSPTHDTRANFILILKNKILYSTRNLGVESQGGIVLTLNIFFYRIINFQEFS